MRRTVWKQNPRNIVNIEIMKEGFKVLKEIKGRRPDERHWVVECNPEVRNWLRSRDQVYVDCQVCRDYADIVRCFRCQGYGHISKNCRDKMCCGHCAGEHDNKDCMNKDKAEVCGACINIFLYHLTLFLSKG